MLSADDMYNLRQLDLAAQRYEKIAYLLKSAVNECVTKQTTKGLDEMVAMSFNAQGFQPQYGGGGGLPPGKYKGVIVDSRQENVEKNGMVVGGYLAFDLTPIEGPLVGSKQTDRLNLHHTNPKTVEIANKQLSAYCHVLNKFQFNDTAELHNIPFCFEIGYQKGEEPSEAKPNGGYTEVKSIADVNGNAPGKAGGGAPAAQQNVNIPDQAAGGVTAQGAGWGGAAQGGGQIDTNVQMPNQGGQQQTNPAQGGAGWGQQHPHPAQGGAGAGWGQAQPSPAAQQQGAGGWQQGGTAQGGGNPAWGQR
jgi:hypothetical protein